MLVNGSSGIAVGMATNIPPHNLSEIIDATIAVVQKPTTTLAEILNWFRVRIFRLAVIFLAVLEFSITSLGAAAR